VNLKSVPRDLPFWSVELMDACPKFSGFGIDREYCIRDHAKPDDIPILDDFFKKMLDEHYDGVYFVDTDRRILCWNAAAERLSGYAASEVVGSVCHYNIRGNGRSGR